MNHSDIKPGTTYLGYSGKYQVISAIHRLDSTVVKLESIGHDGAPFETVVVSHFGPRSWKWSI